MYIEYFLAGLKGLTVASPVLWICRQHLWYKKHEIYLIIPLILYNFLTLISTKIKLEYSGNSTRICSCYIVKPLWKGRMYVYTIRTDICSSKHAMWFLIWATLIMKVVFLGGYFLVVHEKERKVKKESSPIRML